MIIRIGIGIFLGVIISTIPIGIYIYFVEKKFNKLQKEKLDAWDRVFKDCGWKKM